MEFRVLGPFEVAEEGAGMVAISAAKERALLLLLVLHANEVVPAERLIDELWGERPPDSAANVLQTYVSHLRRLLEPGRRDRENGLIVTRSPGYLLRLAPGQLDLHRFESLIAEARASPDPATALDKVREALALWRGRPLSEFASEEFARTEIARLEELRLTALEERIELELQLGQNGDLVGQLEALVAEHPLRERLRAQLMLALYQSGRQAEALETYQRTRRMLVDELGIEPGQALQQLESQILNQDPALDGPVAAGRASVVMRTRRSRVAIVAGCAVGFAIAAGCAFFLSRRDGSSRVPANAVGVIDAGTGNLAASIAVGPSPTLVAYRRTAHNPELWVANAGDQTLTRLDPVTRAASGPVVSLRATPAGLVVGFGSVWVLDKDVPQLLRIDPEVGRVVETFRLPLAGPGYFPVGIAVGDGSLWAAYDSPGQLVRIDPGSGQVVKTIHIGSPTAIAYGADAVWIGGPYDGVTRIDPSTNTVRHREPLPHNTVTGLAVGDGYVWATITADDTVWQLDTDGNIQHSFDTGSRPSGVAAAEGAVWVANSGDGTVTRIDPTEPSASKTTSVGGRPASIVGVSSTNGAELWVAVDERPREPLLPPNGARLVLGSDAPSSFAPAVASVDPAIASSPQAYQWEYATAAKLVNYPDAAPPAGLRPQPELAAGPPVVSDGGKTYTFRIRPGFRFSPPSEELVTAATIRDSIERALSPKLGPNAPAIQLANVVEGANAYHAGAAPHVAGLSATGDTLTIRLTRPTGDLLHRLALPMFSVVPRRTPVIANGLVQPISSAGPYYVASYAPGQQLVLRRNPHYRGSRPHALDEIVYAFGHSPDQAAALVNTGEADYTTTGLTPGFPITSPAFAPGGRLDRQYGARAPKPQRFFLTPTLHIGRLTMNTSRGIFRDARLRRAVNYALERRTMAAQLGPFLGRPSDAYLPRGMPGSRNDHLYPLARPDLARARALARGRGGRAVLWTCDLPICLAKAEIIRRDLAPLGIQVTIRSDFPVGGAGLAASKRGAPFDLIPWESTSNLPDPGTFLRSLFDGKLIRATGNTNLSYFNDPGINARLARADRLRGDARERAFGRIAAEIARDDAPIAVFSQPYQAQFVSARIGCEIEQPFFGGFDLAALCLRKARPDG